MKTHVILLNSMLLIAATVFASTDFEIEDGVLIRYLGTEKNVVIPDGVTVIRGGAFSTLAGLESVVIPESVTDIGDGAFAMCLDLTTVVMPASLKTIGSSAFAFCLNLESIEIPDGVKTIGSMAFNDCTKLTSISLPSGINLGGYGTFMNCRNLETIVIPDLISDLGMHVFYNTKWEETQPDGAIYCGNFLYKYKGEMPENTSFEIKAGVTKIVEMAFWGCNGLTSVTIPNTVVTIGEYAFAFCENLASVTIPSSVSYFESKCFMKCTALKEILLKRYYPTFMTVAEDAFYGVNKKACNLIVPEGASARFKSIYTWREFNFVEKSDLMDIQEVKISSLNAYPNPTSGMVHIQTDSDSAPQVKLFDLHGRLLLERRENEIDLSGLQNGNYLMQVNNEIIKIQKK